MSHSEQESEDISADAEDSGSAQDKEKGKDREPSSGKKKSTKPKESTRSAAPPEEESGGIWIWITNFFASPNFKMLTEQKLQTAFKKFDTDKGGLLDFEEFKAACANLGFPGKGGELKALFLKMDTDSTDFLDYGEFRQCMLGEQAKKLTPKILKKNFDNVDVNKSGTLDLQEFKQACMELQFGTFTSENDDKLNAYFKRVDIDNSDVIDFKEFLDAVLGQKLTKKEMHKELT